MCISSNDKTSPKQTTLFSYSSKKQFLSKVSEVFSILFINIYKLAMSNLRSFIDVDKYGYPIDSTRSSNTYKNYTLQPSAEENLYLNPERKKKSENYMKLRQTYDGISNSNYFKEDLRAHNNDKKTNKFLRSTINGNFNDVGMKREQFGKSQISEFTYGRNSRGEEDYSRPYYQDYQSQTDKYYKQRQYDGGQKKQSLFDQIQQLKKQRERRLKQNEFKTFDTNKYDTFNTDKKFAKKNYVEYLTPKVSKYAFQQQKSTEVTQNRLNRSKSPINVDKNKTPGKNRDKSPILDVKKKYNSPILDKYSSNINGNISPQVSKAKEEHLPTFKQINNNNKQKAQFSINDFHLGKCLGQGKFGSVYRGIHKATNSLFAVKKVPKNMIKSHFMVDQFILEIKLQSFLEQQNVLKIYGFTHDADNMYLILEYMEQGTLFRLFKLKKTLSEEEAAVYLKQICKAVKFIHENAIAHRDIKPQNIVMSNGVCKLCDFGWATLCNQRRKTYCGTFDYAAPEILEGIEYDMSVDLWCLGILAYELMVGQAPFYDISKKQTMKKIMNVSNQSIEYPKTLSKKAISFIDSLVKKDPNDRINSDSLLNHPFLRDVPEIQTP